MATSPLITRSGGSRLARRPRSLMRLSAITTLVIVASFASTGAGASVSGTVQVSEGANGRVVDVSPGEHVTLTLHSTYWSVSTLGAQRTLRQVGGAQTVGSFTQGSSRCVPGQGCGTVTVHYVAIGTGMIRLRATRTTCGEAMRCTPSQSLWTAVVRVR